MQNKKECPNSGHHTPTSSFEEKNDFCHQLSWHHCFMGSRLPDIFDTGCGVKCLSLPSLILIGYLFFELCHISHTHYSLSIIWVNPVLIVLQNYTVLVIAYLLPWSACKYVKSVVQNKTPTKDMLVDLCFQKKAIFQVALHNSVLFQNARSTFRSAGS